MTMIVTTTKGTSEFDPKAGKAVEPKAVEKPNSDSDDSKAKSEETTEESEASEQDSTDENQGAESTDGDEGKDDQENEEAEDESEKGKKSDLPRGVRRRIKKLADRAKMLEQERDLLRIEVLKSKQGEKPASKSEPKNDEPGKPKADDFETLGEYYEAVAEWKFDQKQKVLDANKEEKSSLDQHQKRMETFLKDHDDFSEVIESVEDIEIPKLVLNAIKESEISPKLMYELSKNRKELERISAMSPLSAVREVGKFEAKLLSQSEAPKQKEIKKTKAPAPINPVGGKSTAGAVKTIHEAAASGDFGEYARMRREQSRSS